MCERKWYFYKGTGSETDPNNYICVPGLDPQSVCFGGPRVCAVLGCINPINPSIPIPFSPNIQSYIVIAKAIQTCFPLPPDTPYVCTMP